MEHTGIKLTTRPCSNPGHCLLVEEAAENNMSFSMQMSIERAERIVKCWNAFEKDGLIEELLAACESATEAIYGHITGDKRAHIMENLRKAIAKAKEGVK